MFKLGKAPTTVPEEGSSIDSQSREEANISAVVEEEILPDSPLNGETRPGPVVEEETSPLDSQIEDHPGISPVAKEVASEVFATPQKDIDAVRELIIGLHPSIVPELINGDSVETLIASIAPAQKAYANIVSNMHIPAGGNPIVELDSDSLTTDEKIRRGLSAHQRKG